MDSTGIARQPPGRWQINPPVLVSGEQVCLELRYTNAEAPLPPGAWFRFELEPISVKATSLCPMSEGLELAAFRGNPPKVEIEQQPQTPHGFMPVRLLLPQGMAPHQSFAVRVGNRPKQVKSWRW